MTEKSDWINLAAAAAKKNRERDYWLDKLSGEPVKSSFPRDYQENGTPGQLARSEEKFYWSGSLFAALLKIANRSDTRLHMVLTAGLNLLLSRYSGNRDIMIGSPIYRQETGGKFINTMLVLRNRLEETTTFRELLLQVRQTLQEAVAHQNYPLKILVNRLNLPSAGEKSPLFDVILLLTNIHESSYLGPNRTGIIFSFTREQEGLEGIVEYETAHYEATTIRQIVAHFERLLQWMSHHADEPLEEAPILSQEEIRAQLSMGGAARVFHSTAAPVHRLFETQAARCPDRIAVVERPPFSNQDPTNNNSNNENPSYHGALTYRTLNEQSRRLAHYLAQYKQVRPDTPVGLLLDNSPDLIVSILGTLQAGGAYVPMDPSLPEERLKLIIDDAGTGVIISRKRHLRLLNRLQWECRGFHTFLCLDSRDLYREEETEKSGLMDKDLWEYVNREAADDIEAGGWVSSTSGQPFSKAEMEEYSENALAKLKPLLAPDLRVLEIGCASGLTMYKVAPHVGLYWGTDLSAGAIARNREKIRREGQENIKLTCTPAHQIHQLQETDFDLVIINSVIQSFHGHNYLRQVLAKAMGLIKSTGYLFIGDVMDQELKQEMIDELLAFRQANRGKNYRTKTDWSSELFLSRDFFRDLQVELPAIQEVQFSQKIFTLENELTKFRYDVLLKIDNTPDTHRAKKKKAKYQEDASALENLSPAEPLPAASPKQMAYVIYTSGSTGKPKGVAVDHGGLSNYIGWAARNYVGDQELAFPLFTSVSFDLTVTSIFTPLVTGNTLLIYQGGHKELLIEDLILDNRAGIVKLTPSHLKLLGPGRPAGEGSPLKRFIVGGEQLETRLAAATYRNFNGAVEIYNEYGPTEAVVGCMIYRYRPGQERREAVPIGRPIDKVWVYIVDGKDRPLPRGVGGELVIAGDGLARGYLNDPTSTARGFCLRRPGGTLFEKTVPPGPPWKNVSLSPLRLYKTGDIVRFLSDGNIEFVGRKDQQVKIRGYRLELQEIVKRILLYREEVESRSIPATTPALCSRCLLPANYPGIDFDERGVCSICRDYDLYKDRAGTYFEPLENFRRYLQAGKTSPDGYDCLLLYSGGKDSTYVLYRLVEMGLKVLAFTFDNGFISEAALENVKKITTALKVDRIVRTAPQIKKIFLESLRTYHDVCNGCFKAVNTYGTQIALQKGIDTVVSGVSRGQIFDIKLHGLFRLGIFADDEIQRKQLLFRKNYHSMKDKISRYLGVELNEADLQKIRYVDFFRYDNTPVHELKRFLASRDRYWSQPQDTGLCSTNCRINDAGIYIHLQETGYHNYAAQLSWDCRLGLISREQALKELTFAPDPAKIRASLREIGYFEAAAVKDAVVVDKEDENGDKFLCAYIVADGPIDPLKLRESLSGQLPQYMVPTYIVPIDKIPLTLHGKVDRKALPEGQPLLQGDYAAPRGPLENRLAEIWSEILSLEKQQISANANFFDLGGHSLKATLVVSHIHKELNAKVPLAEIFNRPTLRGLAAHLRELVGDRYVAVSPAEKKEYYDLSSAQKRLFLVHQLDKQDTTCNMPRTLILQTGADKEKLEKVFYRLILRHESLRTSFPLKNGHPVQKIHDDADFHIEAPGMKAAEKTTKQDRGTAEIIRDFIRPFALNRAPLFRVGLLKTGDQHSLLMIDMHHIISDGISQAVLQKEFIKLYAGEEPEALKLQYKDFSEWQNRRGGSEALQRQEQFWLKEFAGGTPALNLPTDFPRPLLKDFKGGAEQFTLPRQESEALKKLAARQDVTLYMLFLALYTVMLAKISGQEEIVVGTAVAGRNHADLEHIIGMFANMVALKNRPAPGKSVTSFLQEIKERTIAVFENQDYQFERLVEQVVESRDPSRNPIFDAVFQWQNFDPTPAPAEGLKIKTYDYANTTAMFDILFDAAEINRQVQVKIEYRKALFKKETIRLFFKYFVTIVNQVLENNEIKIEDLQLMDKEKKDLILDNIRQDQEAGLGIEFDLA